MSWKPQVMVAGEKDWSQNGLVFATEQEAVDNACNLMLRWTLVTGFRAVEVDEPVNYRWVDGHLVEVKA